MFFGKEIDLRGVNMVQAVEEMRHLTAIAGVMADISKFSEICVDFLVNNNGSAPLAGLASTILKHIGIPETQKEIELLLKILIQVTPEQVKGAPFHVKGGYAFLNNVFSNSTITVTLMYGDQALQDGVTDVHGAPIGDAEKRSIRNMLRLLRQCPRLRHELIVSWLTGASYDENTHHKAYPKGGIDFFVALCLGDFTGNPEKDKTTWFASQWELGQHLGQDANKLMPVNDYLGFATTTWKAFNERYGKAGTSFLTASGEAIINSRPHTLMQVLGQALPKLYAGVSLFKEVPKVEPKPQGDEGLKGERGATAGFPPGMLQAVAQAVQNSGMGGLVIGLVEVEEPDQLGEDEKKLAAIAARNAERVYREMTNSALNDVMSFIESNSEEYVEGVKEVLKQMKAMGAHQAWCELDPEALGEFVKYGNPRSINQCARGGMSVAIAMAAAVRFAYM